MTLVDNNINISQISLETKEKALCLYTFIKELVATKYNVVTDIKKQPWHKHIVSIHQDDRHIYLPHYLDTENEQEATPVLIQVKKPHFDLSPEPPKELFEWLATDYKNFASELKHKEFIEKAVSIFNDDGEETTEISKINFSNNKEMIELYNSYKENWSEWAKKQRTYNLTKSLYNDLFRLREELKANPETLEFVIGNGEISTGDKIKHPIITKKVDIEFNEATNSLQILDTDFETQFYNELFPKIEDISIDSIRTYREILANNSFHPLSEQDSIDFLSNFALKLSSDCIFIDNVNKQDASSYRIHLEQKPVFFLRKKIDGTLQFIEKIIKDINNGGNLMPSLPPILGTHGQIQEIEEWVKPEFEQELAALNGESYEILLPKPANREQLQIAEHIQKESAVVVQGPPGTGKTHTIANILGHFLANGKSVLVTSQKSKALSVLQDKLPEKIKGLCVPVLDNEVSEVERSVNEISTQISTTSSAQLLEKIKRTENSRTEILNLLSEQRKKIFVTKFKEFEPITYLGERYSPIKMAKEVAENLELWDIIPSNVVKDSAFPLELDELYKLYATNEAITSDDEDALALNLPNSADFAFENADEFKNYIDELQKIKQKLQKYKDKNSDFDFLKDGIYKNKDLIVAPTTKEQILELEKHLKEAKNLNRWSIQAAADGMQGGGFKKRWLKLKEEIENLAKFSNDYIAEFFGKTFEYNHANEQEALQLLSELSRILQNGKIGICTFLFKSKLKEFYENTTINGVKLKTSAECDIFENYISLKLWRKDLARLWNDLMTSLDVPKFEDFGEQPEIVAKNYCPKIEKYLDWHNNEHQNIMDAINGCGIVADKFFILNDIDTHNEKLIKVLSVFNNEITTLACVIKDYFEVKEIAFKLEELQAEFDDKKGKMFAMLMENKRVNSEICQKMAEAVKNHDIDNYRSCHREISALYNKYEAQNFRHLAIEKINRVAPAWAQVIKNRDGIHGENKPPEKILEAWRHKQFIAILDDITKESFEQMQIKAVKLSRDLRKTTEELVEYKAWYHVLLRIEKNPSMRQALIGWLQTIRKIGKGTGKKAPELRRKSRENMLEAQKAVPAWIMPISKVMDNYSPDENKFDVVIIDEASQSDISALGLFYMANKIIVVGDDKQVSPSAVGMADNQIAQLRAMYIDEKIPNSHLYDGTTSLYDIAMQTFQPLMLKEHFRCVPDIINYSNKLSYDGKIKPLRDTNGISTTPYTVNYSVEGQRKGKANKIEAETIVSIIKACSEQEEYKNKTFGVISLLGNEKGEQAGLIQNLIGERLDLALKEKLNLRVGAAPDFQGDERDIMLLSMVDSNEDEGPLRLSDIEKKETKQRYNVAVSRARDQIWIINSLDPSRDLKTGDIRRDLLEYANSPKLFSDKILNIKAKSDSPFEQEIAEFLVRKKYNIIQQWEVGAYRIDMVVACENRKIALECDGECYHSTEEQVKNDMERQTILERLGWNFIRIRGSEFYRNKEKTFERLLKEMESYEIYPEGKISENENSGDLFEKTKIRAAQIREEWNEEYNITEEDVSSQMMLNLFSGADSEEG